MILKLLARLICVFCVKNRRKMKFCSGTSDDMVIEQTASHEFKVAGNMVGRGFTDDILSSYVLRKPAISLTSEAIEDFSGIAF